MAINRAYLSIWKGDELAFHSSLGVSEDLKIGERYLEFSLNRLSTGKPVISVVYGIKCNNMHLLTIDNLHEFEVDYDEERERSYERYNRFIQQGRG